MQNLSFGLETVFKVIKQHNVSGLLCRVEFVVTSSYDGNYPSVRLYRSDEIEPYMTMYFKTVRKERVTYKSSYTAIQYITKFRDRLLTYYGHNSEFNIPSQLTLEWDFD